MDRSRLAVSLVLAVAAALSGCATPKGDTAAAKRADAKRMRARTLGIFYARMPHMHDVLVGAAGHGVFSAISTHTLIVSSGTGFGIIHDNATGRDTYMRAVKLGGGLGAGVESIRAVVVFHDARTLRDVLDHGWGVSGRAEAAAKIGAAGDSGAVVVTLPGMSIYRFTEQGVMLGGAIEGTKIWKDAELN